MALAGVLLMVFSEGWVLPNIMQMMYCVGMIISGGLGLWCMSSSIRLADVSAVSPFRYARIIFGMITGVVIFNENIDSLTILGSAIIVGAGLYTWSRERRFT